MNRSIQTLEDGGPEERPYGGMGYAEEMWVARYLRDTRLGSIGAGADEVMLRIITMMEGMGRG